jgi:hypothetical protein
MPVKLPNKDEWRKVRDEKGWPKYTGHVCYIIEQPDRFIPKRKRRKMR